MSTRLEIELDLTESDLQRDPIIVAIPGLGDAEFPGVINALAKVRVATMMADGRTNDDLTDAEALALLRDIVPDKVIHDWSAQGFDITDVANLPKVEKVIQVLMAEYSRREALVTSSGKAPSAPLTPPPFSGTGPSSSPTAAVSTASPFPVT